MVCTRRTLEYHASRRAASFSICIEIPHFSAVKPCCLGQAMDAASGMWYLHSRQPPVVHRDLRSPNLLVSQTWTVKVWYSITEARPL